MKIKDLDPKQNLRGVQFIYPDDGQIYFWYSQWQRGVWGKKEMADKQVIPLVCNDLKETLEWKIINESN